tara:strand:+ start:2852 stop:4150 length:1299 start_codon:yes stop_codon:yes gene_type:complete
MIKKKAYVIGGGPLGLALSTKLIEDGYSVIIIEASNKLLGLAGTFNYNDVDIEYYYHFFYKNDHFNSYNWLKKYSKTNPLIFWKDISTDSVVSGARYDLDSIFSVIKLSGTKIFTVLFTLVKLIFFNPSKNLDRMSAELWAKKRFGQKFASQIWIPLLRQKFGDRSSDVSALWLATRIKRHLSTRGKGVGKSKFGYLVKTYNSFVSKFKKELISSGGSVYFNQPVTGFSISNQKISKVITKSMEFNVGNSPVFSAIPYAILKKLFKKDNYVQGLEPFVNMSVVVCLLIADKKLSDHYWTTVSDNDHEFAAIIQQNRLYKKTSDEIIYLSRYCEPDNKLFGLSDDKIYKNWIKSIIKIYPHFSMKNIIDYKIFRSKNAAPLPFINSISQMSKLKSNLENFYFSGYESIYPEDRGVGNSIKLGYKLFYDFKNNL